MTSTGAKSTYNLCRSRMREYPAISIGARLRESSHFANSSECQIIDLFYPINGLHFLCWKRVSGLERDSDKLRRWIIKERLEGQPITAICVQARISRKMFYYWWNRYQAEGLKGLQEKPRGRPCGPGLDCSLKEKVIKLRKRYGWGPNKIAGYLGHRGLSVDHHKVYAVICEEGLNNPITEPRKTWGKKRFQREHVNSL